MQEQWCANICQRKCVSVCIAHQKRPNPSPPLRPRTWIAFALRADQIKRWSWAGRPQTQQLGLDAMGSLPLVRTTTLRQSSKGARFSGIEHHPTHILQYQRPAQGRRGSDRALELRGQALSAAAEPRCDGQAATRPHDQTARAPRASARAMCAAAPAATFRRNWPG